MYLMQCQWQKLVVFELGIFGKFWKHLLTISNSFTLIIVSIFTENLFNFKATFFKFKTKNINMTIQSEDLENYISIHLD